MIHKRRGGGNEEISPNTHLYFPRILSQNQTFACGQVPRLVWGMQGSNPSNAPPLFQRKQQQQQCMYTVAKIKVVICECCEEEKQTMFIYFFFYQTKVFICICCCISWLHLCFEHQSV